jgi:hypothetical protein
LQSTPHSTPTSLASLSTARTDLARLPVRLRLLSLNNGKGRDATTEVSLSPHAAPSLLQALPRYCFNIRSLSIKPKDKVSNKFLCIFHNLSD